MVVSPLPSLQALVHSYDCFEACWGQYGSLLKVAVFVGPQLATTGSFDRIGRREAALRTQEKRPDTSDPTERP